MQNSVIKNAFIGYKIFYLCSFFNFNYYTYLFNFSSKTIHENFRSKKLVWLTKKNCKLRYAANHATESFITDGNLSVYELKFKLFNLFTQKPWVFSFSVVIY